MPFVLATLVKNDGGGGDKVGLRLEEAACLKVKKNETTSRRMLEAGRR
jgi:hypothetical protein